MKLNRLETHDRFLEFNKNTDAIYQGCMECLRNVPENIKFPFYVYAHSRQIDFDEQKSIIIQSNTINFTPPSERLIWSPRISKPKPEPNSYLFLVVQRPDLVQICWFLPKRELWEQYAPGKMTFNEEIWTSIQNYKNCKKKMQESDKDGPQHHHEIEWRRIFGHEAHKRKSEKRHQNMMDRLYGSETI